MREEGENREKKGPIRCPKPLSFWRAVSSGTPQVHICSKPRPIGARSPRGAHAARPSATSGRASAATRVEKRTAGRAEHVNAGVMGSVPPGLGRRFRRHASRRPRTPASTIFLPVCKLSSVPIFMAVSKAEIVSGDCRESLAVTARVKYAIERGMRARCSRQAHLFRAISPKRKIPARRVQDQGGRVFLSVQTGVRWRAARGPRRTCIDGGRSAGADVCCCRNRRRPAAAGSWETRAVGFHAATKCNASVRTRAAALDLNRDLVAECATAARAERTARPSALWGRGGNREEHRGLRSNKNVSTRQDQQKQTKFDFA